MNPGLKWRDVLLDASARQARESVDVAYRKGVIVGLESLEKVYGWTTREPEPMTMPELREWIKQEIARLVGGEA